MFGCDYCKFEPMRETLFSSDYLWSGRTDMTEVFINGKTMAVTSEVDNQGYSAEFEIHYCPMCGAKLIGGTEK